MPTRHSLIWLSREGWQFAAEGLAPAPRAALARWQQADWPAVLRRQEPDTPADLVCLGLPLPPDADGDKIRIPLKTQLTSIQRIEPPLALQTALVHAPAWWLGPLHAFVEDCRRSGITMRIYGSWSWQILTRQSYLMPSSDIDLLFAPKSAGELSRGLALLEQYAAHLPLDGEIVFPDGQAVAWKECQQALQLADPQKVLVKSESGVGLTMLSTLIASLENAALT
ncbi:malonate decarboxylase holo-[acyl-carrier-protein] synthase [Collimonas arenae]|uniref:Malonate decarboxylase holo-[acyl-carrier-protein] synthase n=1 Tax=Collimonas arenae TaxID=279058 RepID=A0A127QK39_9BURK|nr:malonate decarboxylase holo-[acyl-carrier-protein] synthase [Collimonas arenae]AMP00566.1 malonate decarboxylase holo-[acyl-carrier-protein] synthase [Collimonas arenae]AMP10449.1 malonate decarboxylase holo-[acyl-carrier-protein] synthase [Collimonas arenae]